MGEVRYSWRGALDNAAVNELHAEAFEHRLFDDDWAFHTREHSLGWVAAYDSDGLVGFANVLWDGAFHAWLQDMMVAQRSVRLGVGRRLSEIATEYAQSAGCEWLHVDFDAALKPFYVGACGFTPTSAGLINLKE